MGVKKNVLKFVFVVLYSFSVCSEDDKINAAGPKCPMEDPMSKYGPLPISPTGDPMLDFGPGSEIKNLIIEGLTTFTYKLHIDVSAMKLEFEIKAGHVRGSGLYAVNGVLDLNPLGLDSVEDGIPNGNFTGAGIGTFDVKNFFFNGTATFNIDMNGIATLSSLNFETLEFDSLEFDLGNKFMINEKPIDWSILSSNSKAMFAKNYLGHRNAITAKIMKGINSELGKYTLEELMLMFRKATKCKKPDAPK